MIVDVHVHIAGTAEGGNGNSISSHFERSMAFKYFAKRLGISSSSKPRREWDSAIHTKFIDCLNESSIDRAVVLAFDKAYHMDGRCDEAHTLFTVDNDYVANLATTHAKALFGASIHPYRKDAVAELERLAQRGACLVKWLPGAQNIEADHGKCIPFYEALAHYGIPLLCHTGGEHTLKAFPDHLNDPRRLIPALRCGVKVIAAHCGTSLFLHEKSYFHEWKKMALGYENFYGDISAFGLITRTWPLHELAKNSELAAKLVYGSDFPATIIPWSFWSMIRWRRIVELQQIANPLDKTLETLRGTGLPEAVFHRAENLLRIPENKKTNMAKKRETAGV